jgi:hypothetical protein
MHRAVFSKRNTTILHSVYFTKEAYVLMAVVFAIDGILHLMVQNVQNQRLLKELFGFPSTQVNPHRHRHIEGYCSQVPKGHVRVGFWIGKCSSDHGLGDGYTGLHSMSRRYCD